MQNFPYLQVRKAKNGSGIFAKKQFKPGHRLFTIKGRIINAAKLFTVRGPLADNAFRYGPETYLSPQGQLGDFLNHSCNPNAGIIKKDRQLHVIAIADIKSNEEVVIDYSTITGSDDIWTMKCSCGEPACRGTIKKISALPKDLLIKYKSLGIIPGYIL